MFHEYLPIEKEEKEIRGRKQKHGRIEVQLSFVTVFYPYFGVCIWYTLIHTNSKQL